MSNAQDRRGITYGISRLPWLAEALQSVASVRRWMPRCPIELHIDDATARQAKPQVDLKGVFDHVVVYSQDVHLRSMKFAAIENSRFEQTLFLDGDTLLTDSVAELFDLLDRFDLAASHAPQRLHSEMKARGVHAALSDAPDCFPEFNTGVIPFRRTPAFETFIALWQTLYDEAVRRFDARMDQPSFRAALYRCEAQFYALTPEYNLRPMMPNVVNGKVKVIHAHGDLPAIARAVNSQSGARAYLAPPELLHGIEPKGIGSKP